MPIDGIVTRALKHELNELLCGARIEKITQPDKDTVLLFLHAHAPQKSQCLLLCSAPGSARAHITQTQYDSPKQAPAFCMLLRKHLTGRRIIGIVQPELERIIEIHIQSPDALGDMNTKRLIIEMTGRNSNIIFVSSENVILGCTKHVTSSMSRVREVLPGLYYMYPPSQGKFNPLMQSPEVLTPIDTAAQTADKWIMKTYSGISPALACELAYRAFSDNNPVLDSQEKHRCLANALTEYFTRVKENKYSPYIITDEAGNPSDIAAHRMLSIAPGLLKPAPAFSAAIDEVYSSRDTARLTQERTRDIRRKVLNALERCRKKLAIWQETLDQCQAMEKFRLYGDLLTAQLHLVKKGESEVAVINYWSEKQEQVLIPLDSKLTAAQNAQQYYKKYNKMKNALSAAAKQTEQIQGEIVYLEGQLDNLDKSTLPQEIDEIKRELGSLGYILLPKSNMKNSKPSRPHLYISSEGTEIFVGKNKTQNDELTRQAAADCTWLHAKNIPGSHVIIRSKPPVSQKALTDAAMLAAWYSSARASAHVAVDYTLKKYVKKPPGARPGMVTYSEQKTVYVTPNAQYIKDLNKEY